MNIEDQMFMFTEIYGCGKIARIALLSLHKHCPNLRINVYGTPDDFLWVPELINNPKFTFHDIASDKKMLNAWNLQGHAGTANLWSKLILEKKAKYYVHFDSDVIITGDAFSPINLALEKGADLVGTYRNYKHNLNNRDDVRHLNDVVQTAIFAFNIEKISAHSFDELYRMCLGGFNPLGHPVIDFFDPVMFEILSNGGKAHFLEFDEFGGTNFLGNRENVLKQFNTTVADIGSLFCHFASVGSGLKFATKPVSRVLVSESYCEFAIKKYTLFCAIFYGENTRKLSPSEKDFLIYLKDSVVPMDAILYSELNQSMNSSIFNNILESINIGKILSKKVVKKIMKILSSLASKA